MNRFEKEVIKAPEGNIVSGLDNHPRWFIINSERLRVRDFTLQELPMVSPSPSSSGHLQLDAEWCLVRGRVVHWDRFMEYTRKPSQFVSFPGSVLGCSSVLLNIRLAAIFVIFDVQNCNTQPGTWLLTFSESPFVL
jgi:hypothetical protein